VSLPQGGWIGGGPDKWVFFFSLYFKMGKGWGIGAQAGGGGKAGQIPPLPWGWRLFLGKLASWGFSPHTVWAKAGGAKFPKKKKKKRFWRNLGIPFCFSAFGEKNDPPRKKKTVCSQHFPRGGGRWGIGVAWNKKHTEKKGPKGAFFGGDVPKKRGGGPPGFSFQFWGVLSRPGDVSHLGGLRFAPMGGFPDITGRGTTPLKKKHPGQTTTGPFRRGLDFFPGPPGGGAKPPGPRGWRPDRAGGGPDPQIGSGFWVGGKKKPPGGGRKTEGGGGGGTGSQQNLLNPKKKLRKKGQERT